jgi:glycosyltransferase involved in cell wall biosynthesis
LHDRAPRFRVVLSGRNARNALSYPEAAIPISNSISPAISCVIPVFNGKRDLRRAVDSVLAQRPDVQVVLVDDCSVDGSRELALEMAGNDRRIVALALSENRGQGYARNIGVAAADASYITFLDQDDEHFPGWYDHAIEVLLANPQFVALRGEVELAEVPPELDIDRTDPRWTAIVGSPIWNVVIRKVVYQAVGGCPTAPAFRTREGNEDWTLMATVKRHFAVGKTEHPACRHYVRLDGATAYFLRRTRVVDGRFEFVELTNVERQGDLERALEDIQARAANNIAMLRGPLKPLPESGPRGFRGLSARLLARLVRKLMRI